MSRRRPIDIFDKIFYGLVIISIPLIFFDTFYKLAPSAHGLINSYFVLIYFLFAAELIIRLIKTHDKKLYVKNNWIEFVIVAFPFTRILRLAPILEETLIIVVDRLMRKIRHPRHAIVITTIIFMVVVILVTSELILTFEKPFSQSTIKTFPDALWWSTVGVFTTSIGDRVPISTFGRGMTILLVLIGVICLSLVTANIAAIFTEQDIKRDLDRERGEMEGSLDRTRSEMKSEVSQDDKKVEAKLEKLEAQIEDLKR